MKRILSCPLSALAAGLCLRLLFVLKFPADSGDTTLYEQIATNWLKHHAYAIDVQGAITPVDLRMPGYPAFLALVYLLTNRSGEAARLWIMLVQIGVDLISCWLIATLSGLLAARFSESTNRKRLFTAGLWLAALCPFTGNYTAVPLTEVIVVLLTAVALIFFLAQLLRLRQANVVLGGRFPALPQRSVVLGALGGFFVGVATLFRPESLLLLFPVWITLGCVLYRRKAMPLCFRSIVLSGVACVIPLAPWAIRNAIVLHELQFLAPKFATLPGEMVPYGFMAWERTWLYRMRDCYAVPWKLNDEEIKVDEIPARAFDSPAEKRRVAAILEQYNEDLSLTAEEDAAFREIARERTARHPLRTLVWIPAARFLTIWFTPRIELLPISGNVFPLAKMHEVDPEDQESTILFFLLNVFYLGLAALGAWKFWRSNLAARPTIAMLLLFPLLRTAFLTTLETPEPRYVLVCFPAIIALGAQVFARRSNGEQAT